MATKITPAMEIEIAAYAAHYRPAIISISLCLGAIATILILLRIYSYFRVVRNKGGWALSAAIVAWVIAIPVSAIDCYSVYYPMEFNIRSPPIYAAMIGLFSLAFAKLGIALFILEVQQHFYRIGKWFLVGVLALMFLFYVLMMPFMFSQKCTPGQKHCGGGLKGSIWFYLSGGMSAATDIILAIYPAIIITKLQMMRRKLKIVASILMGMGILGAACGIAKAVEVHKLSHFYEIGPLVILAITELWLVQIAAAAAPLWPLVRHIGEKWQAKKTDNNSTSRKHCGLFKHLRLRTTGSGVPGGGELVRIQNSAAKEIPGGMRMSPEPSRRREEV